MAPTQKLHKNDKFNTRTLEVIERLIREGNSKETSARLAQIAPQTLYNWMERHKGVLERVEEAEESNVRSLSKLMLRHGKRTWQALAWYMERRYPKRFAQQSATLIQGNRDGIQIAVIQGGYDPKALRERQEANTHEMELIDNSDVKGKRESA